ncbi:type II secretion system minor pseudopilin GspJ [Thiohalorhabdus sp.]|uniref:type II secretion system minor pseudopilin GspJ n=1 Tax=Thiohalorhabdus sp. TaxID=3094134 RepID=UPI002FC3DEE1
MSLVVRPRPRQEGLTLIELIVALAIFALVATAAYTALGQGVDIQDRLQRKRDFWQRLELAFSTMARDLEQVIARIPQVTGRQWRAPFHAPASPDAGLDGVLFRFSRGGLTSFREGPVSPYQRVSYRLPEDRLVRATWPRVDGPRASDTREAELITGVIKAKARFLAEGGNRWQQGWPPPGRTLNAGEASTGPGLPVAVELTLTFEQHGEFRRVFHVGIPR